MEKRATQQVVIYKWRCIVLIFLVLKYYRPRTEDLLILYSGYMTEDVNYCPECFQAQVNECNVFYENLNKIYRLQSSPLLRIVELFAKKGRRREIQWLIGRQSADQQENLLYKYMGKGKYEYQVREEEDQSLLQLVQYCRMEDLNHFLRDLSVELFSNLQYLNEKSINLYRFINVEPLLMPALYKHNFSVPRTFGVCGFSMIQVDGGQSLADYHSAPFQLKVLIAIKLLEASVQFTNGFQDKYRIYVTDLTTRNVFYDAVKGRLQFIDLDSIFLVRSEATNTVHRYEYIDCPGCLAFVPDDLCSHDISDLNVYVTCRFLNGDLFEELPDGKGFLHPWPPDALDIRNLIQECIECPWNTCKNRLSLVENLMETLRHHTSQDPQN